MEDNVYQSVSGVIVIVNGGNALPGCPESWEQAREIEKKLNEGKGDDDPAEIVGDQPRWKFDCGFKLDFDGPLLDVSSRFYPPKTHYGATWDGGVTVRMFGQEIASRAFDCSTLDELKSQVEDYLKSIADSIGEAIRREKL